MRHRCTEIQRWLDDHRRGALSPERMGAVEEHLAVCPHCQAVFEEREALGALLHATPPPQAPSPAHVARLNRAVLARVSRRRGLAGVPARALETLREWWWRPLPMRGLALAASVASLAIGLWLGGALGLPIQKGSDAVAALPQGDSQAPFATERFRGASEMRERAAVSAGNIMPVSAGRSAGRIDDALFPSVYVIPREPESVGSSWVGLAGLAPENRESGVAGTLGNFSFPNLAGMLALTDTGRAGSVVATAAGAILDEDLLGKLRRFKLDLYLSGDTEMIPDIQRIEEIFYQILTAEAGDLALGETDAALQRRFAEAEAHLAQRDYARAESILNEVAHEAGQSRLGLLSWYHLGNIYHDFHGDFAGALRCYERCLAGSVADFFPPETLARIEHRLALLRDAVGADHEPLRLLRQAEAAPAGAMLRHWRRLLLEHPASVATADGINSLAERALRETPGEPNVAVEAIDLLRRYQNLAEAAHASLAQLRLADIVYYRLRDLPQALIEYGQVKIEPHDATLEEMVRDRIAMILDNRVATERR